MYNGQLKPQKKGVEDKKWKKEQGQHIENISKYGRYQFNYINNHFKCQWSKYTN